MANDPVTLVWFKRDLRADDHAPLCAAAARGRVVPLYIVEAGLWAQPTMAGRHWGFIQDCLIDLGNVLGGLGAPLVIRTGDAVAVLTTLVRETGADAIYAHAETGDAWTYARDRSVAAWARSEGITFKEWQPAGVVRRLATRNGWAQRWDRDMAQPARATPDSLRPPTPYPPSQHLPSAAALSIATDHCPDRQPGGREAALTTLASFLSARGQRYRSAMSSPVSGFQACSRLSPHLAWGTLSSREAAQAGWGRAAEIRSVGAAPGWAGSVDSYLARLHWRCHFMQKLEDEPAIEFHCMHRGYEGLREGDHDPAHLDAWAKGETGYPFVDACMKALAATGWMNFRMRAMLTAFGAYHLWLDWRRLAPPLARLFTDYEPGIHYSQLQMQSGVTGINTTRVYNPVKQSMDQDPDGRFIRQWLPALAGVPDSFVHEPWKMPREVQRSTGCGIGEQYPAPIVDHVRAARAAKAKVHAVRQGEAFRTEKAAVMRKHASRRPGRDGFPGRRRPDTRQGSLDL